MMTRIDNILNRITMYRLVLYVLITLVFISMVFGTVGFIPYSPLSISASTAVVTGMCLAANKIFAKAYDAPVNAESAYITALILVLILPPLKTVPDLALLGWAAILAMASKYILAIRKKHVFNPAAVAVVLTSFGFGGSAVWWVGDFAMTPFVAIGGYLITRKLKREDLVATFIATALAVSGVFTVMKGGSVITLLNQLFFHSSLLFFAGIMLTEPLTMPPNENLQILYGVLAGFLFVPQIRLGPVATTPELALVIANAFSYLVSPKEKLWLVLREKIRMSPTVTDFIFEPVAGFSFLPGQYMEWTLECKHPDSRGNRRYFTIASSPTEPNIRIGVKFSDRGSSFKNALKKISRDTPVIASQLSGSFTLPQDTDKKLAFISGGIGVTPFRSMIRYLIDTGQPRQVIHLYSNRTADEIIYRDVFDRAEKELGIYTIYTLTDTSSLPPDWRGETGRIDAAMIRINIPDYRERHFYLSGPHDFVVAVEQSLKSIGINDRQVVKDYFPGFT